MPSHVFVRCLISRDLNQLNSAKHSNPDQLDSYPNIKEKSESIAKYKVTYLIIQDVALRFRRGWQPVDILLMLVVSLVSHAGMMCTNN